MPFVSVTVYLFLFHTLFVLVRVCLFLLTCQLLFDVCCLIGMCCHRSLALMGVCCQLTQMFDWSVLLSSDIDV